MTSIYTVRDNLIRTIEGKQAYLEEVRKVVDELEFGTRVEANDWLEFFNHNPVADRHGCKTVAVYTGRVNDETGELTEEK